jgi:hypothetical protein
MSVVDEAVAQSLYIKMDELGKLVKVVEAKVDDGFGEIDAKVDDGFGEIDAKIADSWTLTDVRFKGLEENRARIYGEIGHIQDDLVPIANDMVSIFNMVSDNADEVARLAYMVDQNAKKQEQLAKKQEQRQFWWNLVMFMMLGIIIMMLGTIIYVVSLPVTVCPFSFPMGPSTPVDLCKNATNTIFDGLLCLTDKILPRPCREGYACKRDTYPDW